MAPKKAPAVAKSPSPGPEQDAERELMETEALISSLRSKLGRYQQQGDKLQAENFKLSDELEAQKLDLRDINEFLTNELKARTAANAALEERASHLAAQLDESRRACEAEVAGAAADAAREVGAMAGRVAELQRQCASSGEFLERRDALEAELGALRDKLGRQERDWDARVAALERQHLADKERWRREVAARIKETRMQMAQLADQHLEGTTKRALLENEAVASELSYHSAQSARLMAANAALRQDAAELRRQAAIAQRTGESVARKNAALQHIIRAILSKLREEGTGAAAAIVAAAGGAGAGCCGPCLAGGAGACAGAVACGGWGLQPGGSGPGVPRVAGGGPGGSCLGAGPALEPTPEEERDAAGAADGGGAVAGIEPPEAAASGQEAPAEGGAPGEGGRAGAVAGAAEEREAAAAERMLERIKSLGCSAVHGAGGDEWDTGGAAAGGGGECGARGAAGGEGPGRLAAELAERVAALQDELDAARQALAAAAGLDVAAPPLQPPPAAAASLAPRSPKRPSGPGAPPRASCAGVARALDDGVAPFVLFAVQQLRSGRPAPPAVLPAAAGQAWGGDCDEAAARGGAGEWLAQQLLELLHTYDPAHTAPFRGLARPSNAAEALAEDLDVPARGQGQGQVDGGGPGSPLGAASGRTRAASVQQPPPAAAGALGSRNRTPHGCGALGSAPPQLQLPPLPLQLPPASPAAGGALAEAAPGCSGGSGGGVPSVEVLLTAVMSDVRAWGRAPTPEAQPFVFAKRLAASPVAAAGRPRPSGRSSASPQRQRAGASPGRGVRR